MGYFPVFVEMTGRRCLVVGGGPVAERKVENLLEAGARVTVVSPQVERRLATLAHDGRIGLVSREYRRDDIADFDMVFAATDDPDVNAEVALEARARGAWVNAADDAAHSDFILPSVLRRGDLVVAVATGGGSPALSRAIREELETYFSDDYATLARIAADVRQELRACGRVLPGEAWRGALDTEIRRLIAEGRADDARTLLRQRLEEAECR